MAIGGKMPLQYRRDRRRRRDGREEDEGGDGIIGTYNKTDLRTHFKKILKHWFLIFILMEVGEALNRQNI